MTTTNTHHETRCLWDTESELGEGVFWSPSEQAVWFVDIMKHHLHRLCVISHEKKTWITPKAPCFIASFNEDKLTLGLDDGLYLFDTNECRFELIQNVDTKNGATRINDGTVGPDGCIWFGTMDLQQKYQLGVWYRWCSNSGIQALKGRYKVTNGPAFSLDGSRMYYCDSTERKILCRQVSLDGRVGEEEIFVELSQNEGYPDGLTVDSFGYLWVALFGGGAVRRYDRNSTLLASIDIPCPNVTNLTFGGINSTTLFITTARTGLSMRELNQYPMSGNLFAAEVCIFGRATS